MKSNQIKSTVHLVMPFALTLVAGYSRMHLAVGAWHGTGVAVKLSKHVSGVVVGNVGL